MGYNNGKQILSIELIKQIQQYVDGESTYIPKREETFRNHSFLLSYKYKNMNKEDTKK